MWRSGAPAGAVAEAAVAVARAVMGPVLGRGGPDSQSPPGNGEGQSICSALVGSGEVGTLHGRRPLRSRHRIGKPTVLHAGESTACPTERKPGPGGGREAGAEWAGGGGCVGARAGQGGCMGRRAGRAGRAGQDGAAGGGGAGGGGGRGRGGGGAGGAGRGGRGGGAGPGGGNRRRFCGGRDHTAVGGWGPRREQKFIRGRGRGGRVRRPGRAGWWLGRRA